MLGDAEVARERFRRTAELAVADEHEHRVDALIQDGAQGANEVEWPLDRGQPARPADCERAVADAELGPPARPCAVVGLAPLRDVDAVVHHREPMRWGDAHPHEIVAHLLADGDEHAREMCETPLDRPEEALPALVEVAAQDVAVVGVDDRARPRPAREQGRQPACGARLCRVRVQDVGAFPPDDRAEAEDRRGVRSRRKRPLQRRQLEHVRPELVGDVLHRLLAEGERAGDDGHVVSPQLLCVRDVEDMQRGAADIQPCDHVHDPHRVTDSISAATTPSDSQNIAVRGAPP